jgi:hypothetical protein
VIGGPSSPTEIVGARIYRGGDSDLEEKRTAMLIDCDSCAMRDIACADCVVTMLLGRDDGGGVIDQPELDDDERRAVDVLAGAGLIAPLRLVPLLQSDEPRRRPRRSIA